MPEFVKVVPKCRRAKNRVKTHGEIMILRERKAGKFLVESRADTFRVDGESMKWTGWFEDAEAEAVTV